MTSPGNLLFLQDSKRLGLLFLMSAFIHLGLFTQPFQPLPSSHRLRLLGERGGAENAQEVSFFPSGGVSSSKSRGQQKSQLDVSEASKADSVARSMGPAVKGIGQGGQATDYFTTLHAYLDSAKVFPRSLRELGLSGTVRVRFKVSKEGFLNQIQVAPSEAPKILQQEALRFLQKLERVPIPPNALTEKDLQFELPLRYELTG